MSQLKAPKETQNVKDKPDKDRRRRRLPEEDENADAYHGNDMQGALDLAAEEAGGGSSDGWPGAAGRDAGSDARVVGAQRRQLTFHRLGAAEPRLGEPWRPPAGRRAWARG